MADALPPNQAQIAVLKSLKVDAQKSLETATPKGLGVKPASVVELRAWLEAAAQTTEDAPIVLKPALKEAGPFLSPVDTAAAVKAIDERIDQRIEKLQKDASIAPGPLGPWLTETVVEATKGRARVAAKGNDTRAASADEVRSWLDAAGAAQKKRE